MGRKDRGRYKNLEQLEPKWVVRKGFGRWELWRIRKKKVSSPEMRD